MSDLLLGKPVGESKGRFGVQRLTGLTVGDTLDGPEQGLGIGVGAEPGEGLDQAAVQRVRGVADDEDSERIVEPVPPWSLMAQPG